MEFYVIKDLVRIVDLRMLWARCEAGQNPKPSLHFYLNFPWVIKPKTESESGRYLVEKVKEIVKRHEYSSSVEVRLVFTNYEGEDLQKFWIQLHFDKLLNVYAGFDGIFSHRTRQDNIDFEMVLSLCHLPTEDTPISPDALFTQIKAMEPWENTCGDIFGFRCDNRAELEEIRRFWSYDNGFVYSKLSIVGKVNKNGVKMVMDDNDYVEKTYSVMEAGRQMFMLDIGKDLEIRCGNGEIVKAHKIVLAGRSTFFRAMFQASDMEEAKTGRVNMEEMSEEGVRAFMRWIYCNDEKDALLDSDVAVELLIAGDKYNLEELVREMKTIILYRRGFDEEWFTVESVMELYKWSRNLEAQTKLKEKAVGVLKFFEKTLPENLVGWEEYQEMIKSESAESTVPAASPTPENKFCVIS